MLTRPLRMLGCCLCAGLLAIACSSQAFGANLEQVSSIASSKFEDTAASAVNETGAGGVEKGTLYVATRSELLRYSKGGEFLGATRVFGFSKGVAVDQTTGDVYVLNQTEPGISVFEADGTEPIASFGGVATNFEEPPETVANSPEKMHLAEGIAVDASGTVYVSDAGFAESREPGGQQSRVMVYEEQTPGDPGSYSYAGRSRDIAASSETVNYGPQHLALGPDGDLITSSEDQINEFSLAAPATPICHGRIAGASGMAANAITGEAFYISYKNGKGHQMVCKGGSFEQIGEFAVSPTPTANLVPLGFSFDSALAYDESGRHAGILYAFFKSGVGAVFAPVLRLLPTVESETVSAVKASAATLAAQINPQGAQARYRFQILPDSAYEANSPTSERQSVSVTASGGTFKLALEPAEFENEETTSLPYDATALEVQRALEATSSVGAGNVVVKGGPGNPTGSAPYRISFVRGLAETNLQQLVAVGSELSGAGASISVSTDEDGVDGFSGAPEAPIGGAVLGSGSESISISVDVGSLQSETAYRFRVLAEGNGRAVRGAADLFSTYPAELSALPDGRGWEMVSPFEKHGGEVIPSNGSIASCPTVPVGCKPGFFIAHFPIEASPDGDAIVYQGFPFDPEVGALNENEYISRWTPSGWTTTTLSPRAQGNGSSQGYKAFDEHLDAGALLQSQSVLSSSALAGYPALYTQSTSSIGTFSPLLTGEPGQPFHRESAQLQLQFAGGSSDFSRLFFEANDALTEAIPGIAPAAALGTESQSNIYESTGGRLRLVNVAPGNVSTQPGASFGTPSAHAISEDGSRVFWSSSSGQVFMREDGARTLELPDHSGHFLAAASDGSAVLLTDGRLFTALGLESPSETDLTQGHGGFQGIAGQSEDLSRVYFVDTKALTGPNVEGKEPNEGGGESPNLYYWHRTEAGSETVFVATLTGEDDEFASKTGSWADDPLSRTAEASPDGSWLAFQSIVSLTGYDNLGPVSGTCRENALSPAEGACTEAFIYNAAAGRLVCASCNPTGSRPLGPSVLRTQMLPQPSFEQSRYLTDGGRLVFDSGDALSPNDTNSGKRAWEDVYEWEPSGVGSCGRGGGCVFLISGGHEATDSNFMAMDASGKNIFFTTRDRLVPSDSDELIDLYDAREGGGFTGEAASTAAPCSGEACQPASPAPNQPSVGSTSVTPEGRGSTAVACKKGQVKKKGKCAKKPKQAKKGKKKPKKKKTGATHHQKKARHGRGGGR